MLQKTEIITVLDSLNYPFKDMGGYVLTKGVYRGGQTLGSVAIYTNGLAVDFVTGNRYTLVDFVGLCTGLNNEKARGWLEDKIDLLTLEQVSKPLIKQPKIYPKSLLREFLPIHDYFIGRGIDKETLLEFKGGLVQSGQMKNRYTFPIFNSKNDILGFVGRDVKGKSFIPWKILGAKANFVYPAFVNKDKIKETKTVYLVESLGDLLSLYSVGIKNCLALFGIELSWAIIKYLMAIDIKKIYICLNNDENEVGNKASEKIARKLKNYFDEDQIEIRLPNFKGCKDWNEVLQKEGGVEYIQGLV